MYACQIKMKTEGEVVKKVMTQWAKNFKYNIPMDSCERIWKINSKITKAIS